MSARKQRLTLSLLSVLASPLAALADPIYSMTFLPESVVGAPAIDKYGRIALTFQGPAIAQAGLWSGGGIVPLGFLGTGGLTSAARSASTMRSRSSPASSRKGAAAASCGST